MLRKSGSPLSQQALRRLRGARRRIAAEPRRFEMETYLSEGDPVAPCGTAACIAGWVSLNTRVSRKRWWEIREHAIVLLGLTQEEATALFNSGRWPDPYRLAYRAAFEGRFDIAARRTRQATLALQLLTEIDQVGAIWWARGADEEDE